MENTTIPTITEQSVEQTIVNAFGALKGLQQEKNLITTSSLTKYSDNIQKILNGFLSKRGVITKQQLDELNGLNKEVQDISGNLITLQEQVSNMLVAQQNYSTQMTGGKPPTITGT
jgi:hypothetical protein